MWSRQGDSPNSEAQARGLLCGRVTYVVTQGPVLGLTFLIISEAGALCFHFTLNPTNQVT